MAKQQHSYNQTTDEVLMIRPCSFGYNTQTAVNNAFQKEVNCSAQEGALKEFDGYTTLLKEAGIKVNAIEDSPIPHTPDSIFPNNWFSTHSDGTLVLYPMFALNRRQERKQKVIDYLIENFDITDICDLSPYENQNKFLEGTGSMVIDREHGMVFACSSPRTNEEVLKAFCGKFKWDYCLFEAKDSQGSAIYHTNVMMSVGSKYAILCKDSLSTGKAAVIERLKSFGKEIVEISFDQMNHFAGNMLELHSDNPLLVLSKSAKNILNNNQLQILQSYYKMISPDLTLIETLGGGSARCMMAEIFVKQQH